MDHFAEIFIALQKLDNQEDLEAEGWSDLHISMLDLYIQILLREEKA